MAGLFRDWQVDTVPEESETSEMARRRVMDRVGDDIEQVLLLQLLHPRRAALTWERR